ncbi:MAG: penicillin-binding protein 1C [Flavobacteriaceae bacterium]|nr:MAG: penicillin-binding protein 1C [Flavobacteriaceae bacterium]
MILKVLIKHKIKIVLVSMLLIAYYFCLPKPLFSVPSATVVESSEGVLLGAQIASDGQWRFPVSDNVPHKFKESLLLFEDAYFYKHPGFNPVSIAKAFIENTKSGSVKRGGSTITQQVIRLSRYGKRRTYFEKLLELVLATRLEWRFSKEDILKLYASHAPFGGNVVGLDAASWRYFGRNSHELSWSESATLAVLPNAPSMIYPGKNHDALREKRNRLLKKLWKHQKIDSLTYALACEESLPSKPHALPTTAPHLVSEIKKKHSGTRVRTSLKVELQSQVNSIVKKHYEVLSQNQIHNVAVLVVEVASRKVLAYVGNSPTTKDHQKDVNIITKARSTGSILKPFLYASMLDSGDILPNSLVVDVPTHIGSYSPENFNQKYDGVVPAGEALARSLNVPAVGMLQDFGVHRFLGKLKQMNFRDISNAADYYGLSLILGGAECNLWDLCKSFAAFSSTIRHYDQYYGSYFSNEFMDLNLYNDKEIDFGQQSKEKTLFDAGSIYMTYKALLQVNRPVGEENWEFYESAKKIAWKTGTSFGFRDAWAVGSTADFVVGVWVGNADGEGRPGLIGTKVAAPLLFDVFELLPNSAWFEKPFDELSKVNICRESGYLATEICPTIDSVFVQKSGLKTAPCHFHKWVHIDDSEQYQVNFSCEPLSNITHKSWFVLPAIQAHYYKKQHPLFKALPPFRIDCLNENTAVMGFVYPLNNSKIILPKTLEETPGELIVKLVHSHSNASVNWYLDDVYVGTTNVIHEMAVHPEIGEHIVYVVDAKGNEKKIKIEISN